MKVELDLERLTVDERLELIEQIWDSLAKNPDQIPITPAQREELDRRLADLEKHPDDGIPWEQVIERIRARK